MHRKAESQKSKQSYVTKVESNELAPPDKQVHRLQKSRAAVAWVTDDF